MKWIANNIFSKLVLGVLVILLQFGWLVYMLYYATATSSVFNLILHALAVMLALYVINKDIKPYFKLSWVFLILCLPIVGCPCYFLFGRSELTRGKRRRLAALNQEMEPFRKENPSVKELLKVRNFNAWRQSEYITNYAGFPLYAEEDSVYFSSGEEMFPKLLEDLQGARDYIFLEYFILEPGEMLDSIVRILEQKASEGVHIRLIYDDVGSIKTLPRHYYKSLQEKGIHCASFHPFRPILSVIMNNRDHRKICVIDGRIAYTGGVNLADEYINQVKRFGYWKDAAIRITGPAAWSFTTMFLEIWNYIVHGSEDYLAFFPKQYRDEEDVQKRRAEGFVQPFADSPLDKENVSENVYLNIINQANHYVYIFTPYLITSWEMTTALINAAKSGVDVRIVTPGIPDKKLVYLLTQSNYAALINGGVKIYQYTPGFIHSKCIVADDQYGVVGTINLDFRSLYLHFECGVFLYEAASVAKVKEDALRTFEESHLVSIEEREDKNFFLQLLLSILHLLAPLF